MSKEEQDIIVFLEISAITKAKKTIISKEDVKCLLNLIDKLQKENENLKEKYENIYWYFENQKDNFVHKNKIKNKIKELEEKCEAIKEIYPGTYALNGNYLEAFSQIVILRELLGDNKDE